VSEADFIELRGVFSKNDRLAPGSGAYLQSVQAALAAGRVVFDSEWHIDQTRVRVPVLQKTSEGIEATTIRNSKLYQEYQRARCTGAWARCLGPGRKLNSWRDRHFDANAKQRKPRGFRGSFKPPIQASAPAGESMVWSSPKTSFRRQNVP
jgi:hypothetical protein